MSCLLTTACCEGDKVRNDLCRYLGDITLASQFGFLRSFKHECDGILFSTSISEERQELLEGSRGLTMQMRSDERLREKREHMIKVKDSSPSGRQGLWISIL